MIYRALADVVLVLHLACIVFIVAGGILGLWWRVAPWVHIPAALWGAALEFFGWICPLTPLENVLRESGGEAGYPGGFIEHYLVPVIYPPGLTRGTQYLLGALVIVSNTVVYLFVVRRRRASRSNPT